MATRGRKKNMDESVQWWISIPKTVAAKIELTLLDPVTGKIEYGARNQLLTALLRKHVEEVQQKGLTREPGDAINSPQSEEGDVSHD